MIDVRISLLAVLWLGLVACDPAPVLDAAASELDVQPAIIDLEPTPDDGKVPVVMLYFDGGTLVRLGAASSVTCNGVALAFNGVGYGARVPTVPAGGAFTFAHQRDGVTTELAITVPPRPVVTSPASGATLPRTSVELRYVAATSAGVRPSASDGIDRVSGAEQADTGTAVLDVSSLQAGAGTLDVARHITSAPTDSGFASVAATYTIASLPISVVWQ
jgi:hypothetical protein